MDKVIATFYNRIELIKKIPIDVIPKKIEFILSTDESATQDEISLAHQYCCPLCINRSITSDIYPNNTCYICNRKCCNYCSMIEFSRYVCKSKSCMVINRFNKQEISIEQLNDKTRDISYDNFIQWLVLQSKRERQLGSLRALLLIDALYASIINISLKQDNNTSSYFITSHIKPENIEINKRFMEIKNREVIFILLPDKTLSQMTFVGDEKVSHTIEYLILHYIVGLPQGKIVLHFNNVRLEPTHYLSDYNIQIGDILRLSYELKGGFKRHSRLNGIHKLKKSKKQNNLLL